MPTYPSWEAFEHEIQQAWDLDSNPGSGNQFNAPGDAVDYRHPSDTVFPIMADCKFTEKLSFSLNSHFLHKSVELALERGKRFVLPIRFWHRGARHPDDYVVLTRDDFEELLEARRAQRAEILSWRSGG